MSTWNQLSFQDSLSPLMEELNYLHDYINLILLFIISFVGLIMLFMMNNLLVNQKLVEMQMVEWVWTVIPAALLLQIALPSLLLLYLLDEVADVELTIKAVGHQWYWSYEYSDFFNYNLLNVSFDSYMIQTNDLEKDGFRLLEVDNRTCLPYQTQVRLVITSDDVLHSWTIPSLGVKADAVPGRLNQMKFISHRPGLYFGQCSEICGANHSFMPITVEMLNSSTFFNWVMSN